MFEDILDVTLAVPGWETWAVSPDETVLEVAANRGVHVIPEDRPSLSAAIQQVDEEAESQLADALAVLPADVALLSPEALTSALRTLGSVVLAPSDDEAGTNLLIRRPPRSIPARFGRDSFRRHLQEAAEAGLPTAVVEVPELAFDLDLPDDILTLVRAGKTGRTLDVCLEMDLPGRLASPAKS
jgi:2-phospho-L-lactate guanylyltransferase